MTLTIPTDAYGKLCCVIEGDTYKRFTTCDSTLRFHTTKIRTLTYEELSAAYNSLLDLYNVTFEELNYWTSEYQTLNNTHHQLLTDYESSKSAHESLQANFNSLNSSYNSLKKDYDPLQAEHNSLLDAFDSLNSTYMQLLSNHTGLISDLESLQNKLSSLETSYEALLNDYNSLNSTYHTLLNEYERLESTTDTLKNEIQNAKLRMGHSTGNGDGGYRLNHLLGNKNVRQEKEHLKTES